MSRKNAPERPRSGRRRLARSSIVAQAVALAASQPAIADTVISGPQGQYTNSGSIGSVSVTPSGSIFGPVGVDNRGTIGALTNAGAMTGRRAGIVNTGSIGVLNNGGVIGGAIGGGGIGIDNRGTIGSLTNSGSLSGADYAIRNSASGTLGPISNTGTISGNIDNAAPRDLTITGGAGETVGTLTGYPAAAMGTIRSPRGAVTLSGNSRLNDTIIGKGCRTDGAATPSSGGAPEVGGKAGAANAKGCPPSGK